MHNYTVVLSTGKHETTGKDYPYLIWTDSPERAETIARERHQRLHPQANIVQCKAIHEWKVTI